MLHIKSIWSMYVHSLLNHTLWNTKDKDYLTDIDGVPFFFVPRACNYDETSESRYFQHVRINT